MNIVLTLRQETGLTQQAFAAAVGTSQSTIAAYESGSKSPTLRTVERMAEMAGVDALWTVNRKMTREDRRSLAYHAAIVELLAENPSTVLQQAKANLHRWTQNREDAKYLFDRWKKWLALPVQDLQSLMMSRSLDCRDMRQVSPFAGVLSAAQRTAVIKRFQQDEAA